MAEFVVVHSHRCLKKKVGDDQLSRLILFFLKLWAIIVWVPSLKSPADRSIIHSHSIMYVADSHELPYYSHIVLVFFLIILYHSSMTTSFLPLSPLHRVSSCPIKQHGFSLSFANVSSPLA